MPNPNLPNVPFDEVCEFNANRARLSDGTEVPLSRVMPPLLSAQLAVGGLST